jgi:hypothetical protein
LAISTWGIGLIAPDPDNELSISRAAAAVRIAARKTIGSISDGSLFFTLPTRVLTGQQTMPAEAEGEWLYSAACDGFNIMFPWVPSGLDEFVDRVAPELRRRSFAAAQHRRYTSTGEGIMVDAIGREEPTERDQIGSHLRPDFHAHNDVALIARRG